MSAERAGPGQGEGATDWNSDVTAELVRRANEGDPEAWSELYERHRTILRVRLHGRIPATFRGRFDTEDILSSGFLAAYQKIEGFEYRGPESFRAWLARIHENKLHDRLRHHAPERRTRAHGGALLDDAPVPTRDPSPSQGLADREEHAQVLAMLAGLEAEDQEVVGLRLFERMAWRDVAKRLSISESGARKRYMLALEKLTRRFARGTEESE